VTSTVQPLVELLVNHLLRDIRFPGPEQRAGTSASSRFDGSLDRGLTSGPPIRFRAGLPIQLPNYLDRFRTAGKTGWTGPKS